MDQYGLDPPGNVALQLEFHANYFSNMARYPEWPAYFAKALRSKSAGSN
jgi:hypothetical protein